MTQSVSTGHEPQLRPGAELEPLEGDIASALPPGEGGGAYDSRAAAYDKLIGNRLYNRFFWSTSVDHYSGFAARAVASASGPLLDAAAGTCVFTAPIYAGTDRPIVISDRSVGMLREALKRTGGGVTAIHADLYELPFADRSFETIACFGTLHVLEDVPAAIRSLLRCLAPGGKLYASTLVAETGIGRRYLRALHRAGEVAEPRRQAQLREQLERGAAGSPLELRRAGSMAYAVIERREAA